MTHIPDIEPILDSWLAEGTDVLPDRSVEAVLRTVDRTSQRRAWGLPWREVDMNGSSRLAALAGAAIVVVLVVGGLVYLGGSQGPSVGAGGGPAPTPTSTPTPSTTPASIPTPTRVPTADEFLDTATWTTYDSARYGFSIAHPADWRVSPGTHDWDIATDAEGFGNEAPDVFCSPDGGSTGAGTVCVGIWSSTVTPGTTVEDWMELYCTAQKAGHPCAGIADRAVPVVMGGQHPGLGLFGVPGDTTAFFLDGDTIYVAVVWYSETDPEVGPYGGGRALLEALVSTMTIEAASASPAPSP
ncbi:MAG TPA: hypothetical protein VIF84_07505 [Candidatus Limnocylindrales bacterium]|jgi:hypothetical protein